MDTEGWGQADDWKNVYYFIIGGREISVTAAMIMLRALRWKTPRGLQQ